MQFNYEIKAMLTNSTAEHYGHVESDNVENALTKAISQATITAGWDNWPRGTNAAVTVWPKGQPRKETERVGQLMVR